MLCHSMFSLGHEALLSSFHRHGPNLFLHSHCSLPPAHALMRNLLTQRVCTAHMRAFTEETPLACLLASAAALRPCEGCLAKQLCRFINETSSMLCVFPQSPDNNSIPVHSPEAYKAKW